MTTAAAFDYITDGFRRSPSGAFSQPTLRAVTSDEIADALAIVEGERERSKTKFYPSIESLYRRDHDTNKLILEGPLRDSVWDSVAFWELTEKVDGTNFSFVVTHDDMIHRGRTAKAQFNQTHVDGAYLSIPKHEDLVEFFGLTDQSAPVTIYGELYGAGIQKGGSYSSAPRFRAFDIAIGRYIQNGPQFRVLASEAGIPTVPFLGNYRLDRAFDKPTLESILPESLVAIEDSGTFGVIPEGVVARPPSTLYDAFGNRVIWKITMRDLVKL